MRHFAVVSERTHHPPPITLGGKGGLLLVHVRARLKSRAIEVLYFRHNEEASASEGSAFPDYFRNLYKSCRKALPIHDGLSPFAYFSLSA
jgi:hypothetical protein